ncbi:MAG TPA: hypothetical protein VNN18_03345 [Candidatus Xenobia bacterium]|nr:hypothetical protein [Candidatus Xenobia bacterium]
MKPARIVPLVLLVALGLILAASGEGQGWLEGHGFSRAVSSALSNYLQGLREARRAPSGEESPQPRAPTAVLEPASDDEVLVVAAWSPDGRRLAYGTERRREQRRSPLSVYEGPQYTYPGEVWVADFTGKPRRVLKSDILRDREGRFVSFSVERIAWSPDGAKLLVEIIDERKTAATFFLTDEGKRVKLGGEGPNVIGGYGAEWLSDNETAGMLEEAAEPRLLHRVKIVRVAGGRSVPLYEGRVFAAVAWLPQARKMVGIERDLDFLRTPALVVGDLEKGTIQELGPVREYVGGLRATPDETKVSYFVGNEKLAVRGLAPIAAVETYPIPLGRYAWAGAGAVLYIEPQKPGGRVGWLTLFDLATKQKSRLLGDDLVQDFWVTTDGRQVAVLTTGLSPQIKVYRLQE